LCRLEQRADRETVVHMHRVLVDQFIQSFEEAPKELVLDFDATDNPIHGDQVGKHFNAYYDSYCFLPLYVFCGHQLMVRYLRPASRSGAYHRRLSGKAATLPSLLPYPTNAGSLIAS
jgi:hypothetical protein